MAKKKEQQTIVFEIRSDGTLTADAEGFVKDACLKELDALLKQVQSVPLVVERKDDSESRVQQQKTINIQQKQTQILKRKS